MCEQASKRQRAIAVSASVAAMSGTAPELARGHHTVLAFMWVLQVIMLGFALRLLYQSKHER